MHEEITGRLGGASFLTEFGTCNPNDGANCSSTASDRCPRLANPSFSCATRRGWQTVLALCCVALPTPFIPASLASCDVASSYPSVTLVRLSSFGAGSNTTDTVECEFVMDQADKYLQVVRNELRDSILFFEPRCIFCFNPTLRFVLCGVAIVLVAEQDA